MFLARRLHVGALGRPVRRTEMPVRALSDKRGACSLRLQTCSGSVPSLDFGVKAGYRIGFLKPCRALFELRMLHSEGSRVFPKKC